MNILLLGRTGQVGFELHRTLSALGSVVAPSRKELDLTNEIAVSSFLKGTRADLIVNAAAWTAVDAAEEQPTSAWRLNAQLPEQLAEFALKARARIVHFSSDYVYPGSGDQPWIETSQTQPLNVYGQTKLKGDEALESSGADHLIFRTSWVYSARGNNFMKTMMRLAASKSELNVVSDQIGAPTPARLIAQIATLAVHLGAPKGVYHLAPSGYTSWQGFAKEIFRLAEEKGESLMLGPQDVHPIKTVNYPTPAARPLNSRLDLSKLEQTLDIKVPTWQGQLKLTLDEYLEK